MPPGNYSVQTESQRLMKDRIAQDIRMQSMQMMQFRNLTRPEPGFGKQAGQVIEIEKWHKIPKATSPLNEQRTIPINKGSNSFEQITVEEYGNATQHTQKLETLAQYQANENFKQLIAINQMESMDDIAGQAFQTSDVFYVTTSATAGNMDRDGTVTGVATNSVTAAHIRDIVKNMRNDRVPFWDGRRYFCVGHIFFIAQLLEDTQVGGFVDIHKYDTPEVLISGEVGQYYSVRFLEENNVLASEVPGGNSVVGEAVFFGDDAVGEGLADPEHPVFEEHDFGRFKASGWYGLTGFKKIWTNTTDGEYRIVRFWSAAS